MAAHRLHTSVAGQGIIKQSLSQSMLGVDGLGGCICKDMFPQVKQSWLCSRRCSLEKLLFLVCHILKWYMHHSAAVGAHMDTFSDLRNHTGCRARSGSSQSGDAVSLYKLKEHSSIVHLEDLIHQKKMLDGEENWHAIEAAFNPNPPLQIPTIND